MNADFIQLKERADPFFPELIQNLKQRGIRINYYGTNSAEKLKQLFAAGVDFPLVDDVSGMMKVADELGIKAITPVYGEKND
jgi:glycerophosphoryl diester phosphodiesterase